MTPGLNLREDQRIPGPGGRLGPGGFAGSESLVLAEQLHALARFLPESNASTIHGRRLQEEARPAPRSGDDWGSVSQTCGYAA